MAPTFYMIYDAEESWAPVRLQTKKGIEKYRAMDDAKFWKTMDLTKLNKNDQELIDIAVRTFVNPALVPDSQKAT